MKGASKEILRRKRKRGDEEIDLEKECDGEQMCRIGQRRRRRRLAFPDRRKENKENFDGKDNKIEREEEEEEEESIYLSESSLECEEEGGDVGTRNFWKRR